MRPSSLAFAALLLSSAAVSAQDVRGVLENLNRAVNPQQQQDQNQTGERDRDMDRLFRSEAAREVELRDLSAADLRRYENLPPGERRRWDEDFAKSARDRFQRMSESDRRRYLDEVDRADRRSSGSSVPDRERRR
jgi:hypothetical protein